MTKDEALAFDLALEALNTTESDCGSRAWEREQEAITAIKQVRALDKKAENARELGLDYGPVWDNLPSNKDVEEAMRMKRLNQLATPPAAQPAPVTLISHEQHIALREAFAINSADLYFEANPTHDNDVGRMLFERGFARGFDTHEHAIETAKKGNT